MQFKGLAASVAVFASLAVAVPTEGKSLFQRSRGPVANNDM